MPKKTLRKSLSKSVLDIEAGDVILTVSSMPRWNRGNVEPQLLTVDSMTVFYSTGDVRIETVEGDVFELRDTDQVTVLVEVEMPSREN